MAIGISYFSSSCICLFSVLLHFVFLPLFNLLKETKVQEKIGELELKNPESLLVLQFHFVQKLTLWVPLQNAKFLIYQQKFLELLELRKIKESLDCLRNELTPLNRDPNRLHFLSRFLLLPFYNQFCLQSNYVQFGGRFEKESKLEWKQWRFRRSRLIKDLRGCTSLQRTLIEPLLQRTCLLLCCRQKDDLRR